MKQLVGMEEEIVEALVGPPGYQKGVVPSLDSALNGDQVGLRSSVSI